MDFEKEFFELLKTSEAKKIIQDMFGEVRYSENEAIQREDMHINKKNIIRKRIKNIKPKNEKNVRKLEEEVKQYEIQYQKVKTLSEKLKQDIEAKESKINQLEKNLKEKDNIINQLEQEVADQRSEYDELQKNYIEEKNKLESVKQQLTCYEDNFSSVMEKYKSYQKVSEATREGLENVICEKDAIGFVVSCSNIENLQRIWEYTKDILSDSNKLEDVEILKEIFDYFFKVYNESLAEAIYQRDDIAVGDDFDDEYQSRSRESATSGTITKVLLRGYSSINTGKIICKSVVQV